MTFQYPTHPNTGRTDPFVGPDGKNPFADSDAPAAAADNNPYAVPEGGQDMAYRPVYEVILPHRGRTVFWLGALASASAGLATASAAALWAVPSEVTSLLGAFCPVLIIASLTLGGTAWMLGRHDLQAIRCGAMDPAGLKLTRRGHRLGVVGTLIAAGTIAIFLARSALG